MSVRGWDIWLLAAPSLLCAAILVAPLAAATAHPAAAALLYMLFAPLCHQLRERSFLLLGFPLAVCARCTGIYLGVWLGMLGGICKRASEPGRPMSSPSRRWIVIALALMAVDVATELADLRPPLAGLRLATGLLLGVSGGVWLRYSVRRLAEEIKRLPAETPSVAGSEVARLEQSTALVRIFW